MFEAPVELGAERPWVVENLIINGVDHAENYQLQDQRHINDLVNHKTIYTSILTVPSTISGTAKSLQVELSARINGSSLNPFVTAETYYHVDSYRLELSTPKGCVFPEPESVDAQDVGSIVWARARGFDGPIDLNETDYARNYVAASRDKFIWETNKFKPCYFYEFSTRVEHHKPEEALVG